jgi:hypothetical protein
VHRLDSGASEWRLISDLLVEAPEADSVPPERGCGSVPPLALREAPAKGRYLVLEGGGEVSAGEVLMEVPPVATIVGEKSLGKACHACFGPPRAANRMMR